MRIIFHFSTVLLLVLIVAINCAADQLTLKNNDRLTGDIVKFDGKVLVLKTEFAGNVSVVWEAIDKISTNNPVYVTLNSDKTIFGQFSAEADRLKVALSNNDTQQFAKNEVKLIRSESEQKAFQAEEDRFKNPGLLDLIAGSVDLGYSLSRGNADASTFNLTLQATRETRNDKTSLFATSILTKTTQSNRSVTTANAVRGGLRYDRNINSKLFAYLLTDLERNRVQLLNIRAVTGGGFGYHAFESRATSVDVFGGATFNREKFSTGLNRSSAEGTVGQDLTYKLNERVFFKERFAFFPNLTNTGQYRVTFDASTVTMITKRIGVQFTVSNRYTSITPPGVKKNDLLFTTGLRLTFAK
ncbi:MAG: DUF481 domain-containing protein [Blastocatellia bacterium]|nr:DUF481 domain-containing protein [Blastocatellia bacterium]